MRSSRDGAIRDSPPTSETAFHRRGELCQPHRRQPASKPAVVQLRDLSKIPTPKTTVPRFRENDANGNNYSYTASFCPVKTGTYKLCAPPLLSCRTVTKEDKKGLTLTYGTRSANNSILVGVQLLNSDSAGPYDVVLKLQTPSVTLKTVKTTKDANQGTGCNLGLSAEFKNVKPGDYTVCLPKLNLCQDVTQVPGKSAPVILDGSNIETNGNNPCVGGPTPIPPPPSPPCLHWDGNGVCQTFGSTFGAFYTNPDGLIQKIFAVLLSVSGGIALLLIMKAGYQMMTAQGNPEKLNNAREQLVAAIVGLIFLIFSFVFLQLIGFDILRIPGFQPGQSTANNTPVCAPNSCIPMSFCNAKNPGRCNSNGCPSGKACVQ